MRDVARLAGVSPKTVSNVVNGQVPVRDATRERVQRAVEALDYVPNLSARGLRNGRTGVIALALPTLASSYSAELAHHVVDAAARRGWRVQVEETAGGGRREAELLSRAREHLVDGLVLNPVLLETSAVQRGVSLPPVVLIGEVDQPVADHVWVDNVGASRAMTELLLAHGHRRVAVLGVMRSASSRLREEGFRQAYAAAGLALEPALEIRTGRWDPASGYEAVRAWLRDHRPPDALFCFTDSLALGALHALSEAGLRVPADLSVVGYDDVAEAAHFSPPLTTITFDKAALAEAVLDRLARRIAAPDEPVTTSTVPYAVVERESVATRHHRAR